MARPEELLKIPEAGTKAILIGNYAIARGALEAGVDVVTGYPGTPSTETLEILAALSKELGFYAELSVNEKVAVEVAGGAALSGYNALTTMKHVGLNVAADFMNTLNLTGTGEGAFVIYVADDVGAWVSQNEQDSRVFAEFLHVPCLSAYDQQSAKDLTVLAFKLSKKFSVPFIIRTTERISHASGVVEFGPLPQRERKIGSFKKDLERYYLGDVYVQKLHKILHNTLNEISKLASDPMYHIYREGKSNIGIIGDGVAMMYAIEAAERLHLQDEISILGLTFVNPIPEELVAKFISKNQIIIIAEEVEPYIEKYVHVIISKYRLHKDIKILGRYTGDLPWSSELSINIFENLLLKAAELAGIKVEKKINKTIPQEVVEEAKMKIAPRYLTFCPGCPHLGTFYSLKRALLMEGKNLKTLPVNLDIGCYGLAPFSNVNIGDTSFCMGSGITLAQGMALAIKDDKSTPVIGVIGDSTFFHAGMTGTVNAYWNNHPVLIVVTDNRTTAMTGHQPHPGVEHRIDGTQTKPVSIERLIQAIGVEFVEVVDPYNIKQAVETFRKAIEYISKENKPAVIISRRECALIASRRGGRGKPYKVDPEKCIGCRTCLITLGCTALQWDADMKKASIRPELCIGCGMCSHVCPLNAIVPGDVNE